MVKAADTPGWVAYKTASKEVSDQRRKEHPIAGRLSAPILRLNLADVGRREQIIRSALQKSSILSAEQSRSGDRLSVRLALSRTARVRDARVFIVQFGIATILYGASAVIVTLARQKHSSVLGTLAAVCFVLWFVMYARAIFFSTPNYQRRAAWRAYQALLFLDSRIGPLRDAATQRDLIRKLEKIARSVERIPFMFGVRRDPLTASALFAMAGQRATKIREMKVWIAAPVRTTHADVSSRLLTAMNLLLKQQWSYLEASKVEVPKRIRVLQAIGLYGSAAILIGGLILVNVFSAKLGQATTIITTVISVALVSILSRSGLAVSTLQQGISAAESVKPDAKEKE